MGGISIVTTPPWARPRVTVQYGPDTGTHQQIARPQLNQRQQLEAELCQHALPRLRHPTASCAHRPVK